MSLEPGGLSTLIKDRLAGGAARGLRRWALLLPCIAAMVLLLIAAGRAIVSAAPAFHPAKYRSGVLPTLPPPTVVSGGEVLLELEVNTAGLVRSVRTLRSTPPYTDAVVSAARTWRFAPAEVENERPASPGEPRGKPVDSTVLVAAVFRAPTLNSPTLGELARDVATGSDSTPFPLSMVTPGYPPLARLGGIVMVETTVDAAGRTAEHRVVQSSPPFDEPTVESIRRWMFRPARVQGSATPTLAYVIVAFQQPVTGAGSVVPSPH